MSDTVIILLCYLAGIIFYAIMNYIEYLDEGSK